MHVSHRRNHHFPPVLIMLLVILLHGLCHNGKVIGNEDFREHAVRGFGRDLHTIYQTAVGVKAILRFSILIVLGQGHQGCGHTLQGIINFVITQALYPAFLHVTMQFRLYLWLILL